MSLRKKALLSMFAAALLIAAGVVAGAGADPGFRYNAHPFDSGKCRTGDLHSKCYQGSPGDGWGQNVAGGAEDHAARLGSWSFGYAGLDVDVPGGDHPITFSQLTQLQTDYAMTYGTCVGGAPRWSITVVPPGTKITGDVRKNPSNYGGGNISVYFGSAPTSGTNACPEAQGQEVNTGNYIGSGGPGDTPGRYDATQVGGPYGATYTSTNAQFGSWEVLDISLDVDAGWDDGTPSFGGPPATWSCTGTCIQEAVVDQVQVNGTTSLSDDNKDGEDGS